MKVMRYDSLLLSKPFSFVLPSSLNRSSGFQGNQFTKVSTRQGRRIHIGYSNKPHFHPICSTSSASNITIPSPNNFFLNTNLERFPCSDLPSNARDLLEIATSQFRFLPIWQKKPIVFQSSDQNIPATPVFWTVDDLSIWLKSLSYNQSNPPVTIPLARSTIDNITYFAVDVSQSEKPPLTNSSQDLVSIRQLLSPLPYEEHAALLAHATAILSWHASTKFCSSCGTQTTIVKAATARACPNPQCPTRNIYPRIMPSVLILVTRSDTGALLLGRKPSWRTGRYSLLAGYAEIFESLEQTVCREVFEETSVIVDPLTIQYHSSQPWPSSPFPSLMSGFHATVTNSDCTHISVDPTELDDAKWFDEDWLKFHIDRDDNQFSIPGHSSLSRRMITEWLKLQ